MSAERQRPSLPSVPGRGQGSPPAVWLVEGDDAVLVSEAVGSLVDELVGDSDRSLVVEELGVGDTGIAEVADACQTPPFLADRRVVVVRDVGRFATEELGALLAYLDNPLPTSVLVLAAGAGRIAPKLIAAVKAHGEVRSTQVSPRDVHEWLSRRVTSCGLHLDAAGERLLEAHLGEDVSRLGSILDVLVSAYGPGARLGAGDIEPYLGQPGSVTPWELTDAIDAGRNEAALALLHRMLEAGERHPLVVLSSLHRHVQAMLRVDGDSIVTEAQAAAALGIAKGRSTYPAKKALASARRLGRSGVGQAVVLVADAELALKGALDWPSELVLEVLVARLCRLSRARSPRPGALSGSRR